MLVSSTVRDAAVKSDDRATVGALRRWFELQNGEREFYCNDYHPGNYVFTFEDGRPPHPDTTRQRFDRLAAAAAAHHFHDLRHPFATDALNAGVRPKVISERIGHADVGFFLQTYAHVLTDDDRDVAEQAASIPPATLGIRLRGPLEDAQPSRRAAARSQAFTNINGRQLALAAVWPVQGGCL
jgi:hypothetical protein